MIATDANAGRLLHEAVEAWNPTISEIANQYLGPKIEAELLEDSVRGAEMFTKFGVISALTGQENLMEHLVQYVLETSSKMSAITFLTCRKISTIQWCSEYLGLSEYAQILAIEIEPMSEPPASVKIQRFVTNDDDDNWDWLGTVEKPTSTFTVSPIPALDRLFDDMANLATYRRFPSGNDLKWGIEDFNKELAISASFARARMGLPAERPDHRMELDTMAPADLRGFPPQIDVHGPKRQ
ncbi:hypothetical protein [Arthrobacter sp. UM1]|uniref:hypothetical protein n=1 Tax=Arthrobacter sp. UM1 TaxID=2766776 RepID=UPI001CF66186|nr:hypothetical protein [Arthrobacter sp. UM1]MCB4208547.1 hypothetical protein [Arthrobacter sp. UM1]